MMELSRILLHFLVCVVVQEARCSDRTQLNKCEPVHINNYKSFDQCDSNGYAMDCSFAGLNSIPHNYSVPPFPATTMCMLDLSHNDIKIVGKHAFQTVTSIRFLYLNNNSIHLLQDGAFNGLDSLRYINLSINALAWSKDDRSSISKGAFIPLGNLTHINIKENNITSYDGLDEEFQHLKSLQALLITGCENCTFGSKIRSLKNLRYLNFASRSPHSCQMKTLPDNMFKNFNESFIQNLSLSSCNIKGVGKQTLQPFNHSLVDLDISYNPDLKFDGMNDTLGGLVSSNKLQRLNVNRIHDLYERGTKLKLDHVINLHTLRNLTFLYMDLNKLEVLDVNILNPNYMLPTSLKHITLSGNRLIYGEYVHYIQNIKGLQDLDLSRQHLTYDPFYDEHFELAGLDTPPCSCLKSNGEDQCLRINLPPGIRNIDWHKSFLYFEIPKTVICQGESLKRVDLSFNLLRSLQGPVFGVESVTYLDLSLNLCKSISETFLMHFESLSHLNVSFNMLGKMFKKDYGRYTFRKNTRLISLDLSNNMITTMPHGVFEHLVALEYLNVSFNIIGTWAFDLKHSTCLKSLNLKSNTLDTLPRDLEVYFDELTRSICNNGTRIGIVLSHNPIQCTCHTRPFLKWMLDSPVYINFSKQDECRLSNGDRLLLLSKDDVEKKLNELDKTCADLSWIFATSTAVVVCLLTAISTLVIYRKRWKLRHLYYSRKRRHVHQGYQRIFNYDAFVSYPKDMAIFIKNTMVPALEDKHGLKLWVTDRDSHPGASVAENIVHAIYNSKTSVHLISKTFMEDKWCDYEINMAHMEAMESKRKCCLVIVLIGAKNADIPLDIMKLLDMYKDGSLQYPEEGNADEIDAFWTHLVEILKEN